MTACRRVVIDDATEIDPVVAAKKEEGLISVCQGGDQIIMTPEYVASLYAFTFGEEKPTCSSVHKAMSLAMASAFTLALLNPVSLCAFKKAPAVHEVAAKKVEPRQQDTPLA